MSKGHNEEENYAQPKTPGELLGRLPITKRPEHLLAAVDMWQYLTKLVIEVR